MLNHLQGGNRENEERDLIFLTVKAGRRHNCLFLMFWMVERLEGSMTPSLLISMLERHNHLLSFYYGLTPN
jgi:hypothetical protein